MKKIKFTGKLSLNKETVGKLNNEQMNRINGGSHSAHGNCVTDNGCLPITYLCPTDDCNTSPGMSC